jgi:hypothetical protein
MTETEKECRWTWIHAAFEWECWKGFYRAFPERLQSLSWCSRCGCGNDISGYAHLPTCRAP